MIRLEEFRIYYNHTIHPELMRTELRRKRLLRLMAVSLVLILFVIFVELYINILLVTLIGAIPISFYVSWLFYQVRKFRQTFKPNIVGLLLDFMDDSLNFGEFTYKEKKFIPKKEFLESQIFVTKADNYLGEDYISGTVGNLKFELCEIRVQDKSPVDSRLREVFKGIFLRTKLDLDIEGALLMLPKDRRQFLERSIKKFIDKGGRNITNQLLSATYGDIFNTYAISPTRVTNSEQIFAEDLLSIPLQHIIADFCTKNEKEIFISFINDEVYIFLTELNDFLEPNLLKTNVSFEMIRDFFEDISLVVQIIEEFDRIY